MFNDWTADVRGQTSKIRFSRALERSAFSGQPSAESGARSSGRRSSLFPLSSSLLALVAVLCFTACKPPVPNALGAQVDTKALKLGTNTFTIQTDPAVTAPTLALEANMNMTGHGSPKGTAKRTAPGQYRAENFTFTMAGDWVLSIRAEDGGKVGRSDVPVFIGE